MAANHEMQVNKIKKHKQAVQSARKQKINVQKIFDALRLYSAEARDMRIRSKKVKEAYLSYRTKKAIVKWHRRT